MADTATRHSMHIMCTQSTLVAHKEGDRGLATGGCRGAGEVEVRQRWNCRNVGAGLKGDDE